MLKYSVIYSNGDTVERLGDFGDLENARQVVYSHLSYKKSWYTKRGNAAGKNPNRDSMFRIWDNEKVLGYEYFFKRQNLYLKIN